MTNHTRSCLAARSERGMALITTLLLLLIMSGLAVALTTSGNIEVAIGDNEEVYAGARAAAESGLNRAAAQILALTNNPTFPLNNLLLGPDGVVDASDPAATVNADNGLMTHLPDMSGTPPWTVGPGSRYSYNVRLYDDDDPILKGGVAFTSAELTAMGPPPDPPEDGTGMTDVNRRIVIRADGFGPRGTHVTIDQMLTPIRMPALLVDGTLLLTGSAQIQGTQGSVHANENLTISGSGVTISENATATGTLTAGSGWTPTNGMMADGMPAIPVPDIRAADYFDEADFVLHGQFLADGTTPDPLAGTITNRTNATVYCSAGGSGDGCRGVTPPAAPALPPPAPTPPPPGPFGLRYSATDDSWDINPQGSGNNMNSATYFAYTDVKITGNPGTATAPIYLTIIATGNIEVTGNPDLRPEPSSDIQFVTEKDLSIAGNITIDKKFEGRILVREQIDFSGSATLAGQVIVQDVPSISTLVENNRVLGNLTLEYNGNIETIAYTVSGWRETP